MAVVASHVLVVTLVPINTHTHSKVTPKATQGCPLQGRPLVILTTGLTSRLAPVPSHDLTLCPSALSPSALTRPHNGQRVLQGCVCVCVIYICMCAHVKVCEHYQATCHSFISNCTVYTLSCVVCGCGSSAPEI